MAIHPTAIIADDAKIDPSVEIGPFCIIESDVEIGEGTVLESSCRIYSGSRIGKNNWLRHSVVIGAGPQDLTFDFSKKTGTVIGDHNVFHENSAIHRATNPDRPTTLGNHNTFMGMTHAGHDCQIGNHNIVVQSGIMAGHVHLGDYCFVSGLVAVHQFCNIGDYAMLAGCAKIVQDVPPYATADGNPSTLIGINAVGLKRAGFSPEVRSEIKNAYKLIFQSKKRTRDAIQELADSNPGPEVQKIVDFFQASKRGVTDHR